MVQPAPDQPTPCDPPLVIPEIEETAEIATRVLHTGTVRITKHVHDIQRTFEPSLHEEHFRIERVPVHRVIKHAPDIRQEGDTTIIPVVEEVMVKLLLLKEEVRVTRETVDRPAQPQHVTLRREEVVVERQPGSHPAPAQPHSNPA